MVSIHPGVLIQDVPGSTNMYSQGPHSHILLTGWSDRGSYFIPQKIPTSEFVYPKKSLLFLAYPKKSLSVFASANFIIYLLES